MIVTTTNRTTYELSEEELINFITSDAHIYVAPETDRDDGSFTETPIEIDARDFDCRFDGLHRLFHITVGGTEEYES